MYNLPQDPAVVLVIDGDPLTLTGVAAVLDVAGYVCHCARDAEAAFRAVRTLPIDLIICDVNLDGESGLDLVQELRDVRDRDDVPVLFVSSAQMPDIIRRSHDAGGTYYLRKPFDPDVLIELVGKALWMPHLVKSRFERREPARSMAPRPSGWHRQRSDSQTSDSRD